MSKEYIRTTHNFNNETRTWEFRGDKGQDKFGIWKYHDEEKDAEIKMLGHPLWSFGVHALKNDGWRNMNWIVEETIKMYLGGAADHLIEREFQKFINETPGYRAIIESHILKEFEILLKRDEIRVRE